MADDGRHLRRAVRRLPFRLLISAALAWCGGPRSALAEDGDGGIPWLGGSFEMGVEVRGSDGDSDLDLDQTLRLRIDPPSLERVHLRGALWMTEDLDGDEDSTSILRGLSDAYNSDVQARLLYLYVDVDDLIGDSVLRLGRQRILEGVAYNRIDGIYYKQRFARGAIYGFGGVRASLYADTSDDLVLGGGAAYRPSQRTRLAVDVYYGEEDGRSGGGAIRRRPVAERFGYAFRRDEKDDLQDTVVGLSVRHDFSSNVQTFARYTWRDGDGDEILLNLTGYVPPWDLTAELTYRGQLNAAGDQVRDRTAFYRILGNYESYDNFLLALHRPLTEKILFSLEAEFNEAEHDDPLTANRDFKRYAAVLSAEDWLAGFDAQVSVERWDVSGSEGSWAVSGEVGKEWESVEGALGLDFERYEDRLIRYDWRPYWWRQIATDLLPGLYTGFMPLVRLLDTPVVETRENVYSVYGRARWSLRENQDLTARASYSEDAGPDDPYWRIQAGYEIRF